MNKNLLLFILLYKRFTIEKIAAARSSVPAGEAASLLDLCNFQVRKGVKNSSQEGTIFVAPSPTTWMDDDGIRLLSDGVGDLSF